MPPRAEPREDPRSAYPAYPAYDEPECVEPGLWRISVPLPFALRTANIYLLADGAGGWTLIDSGLGLPADEAALRDGLARAGVALTNISPLVLTHAHPDHIGLSGLIQSASGAPVYMLAGEDERLYEVWGPHGAAAFDASSAHYAAHGLPAGDIASGRAFQEKTRQLVRLPAAETVRLVRDGETLTLGSQRFQVFWTPGHSDYHLCLLREDGLFIAGDHILPGITPNIGLYPHARPNPLQDYFEALTRVRDLPARLVLPGHRRPFTELAARVDALRAHHVERSALLLSALAAHPGGATATMLSIALFGDRLQGADDHRFALVETLAHLEYLRAQGQAARELRAAVWWYVPQR